MATEQLTSDWAPENFFETTLSADITDSDTDILLSSVPTQSEGTLVINPDSSSSREIIYYNSKTSTKVTCPSAALGRGYDNTTATSHTSGTKVIMAPIADWFNSLKTLFDTTEQGWTTLSGTHSVGTGYNSGNRSFEISTSTDHSSILSEGMRYRVTRDTTPPTQCADLESSSSHYASKTSPTGITFTDDFTCEAWIKLESYGQYAIASRYNGTSGFLFWVDNTGQVLIQGVSGGPSNYRRGLTYQSIPLNKWVHVAGTLNMSGSSASIFIDGVSVPVIFFANGTSPSSLTQAGDLAVGAYGSGTLPFDGKLADVRVWSDIRTATEIRDNMYAYPSDTTGLVAHFKLNGDFTDASSNGNDLTAQNSAVATDTDNPWNATEYGIITNVTSSTIQVFCPEGYGIPNETLTAPFYSTQKIPFGFPAQKNKWEVRWNSQDNSTNLTSSAWTNTGNMQLQVPIGSWKVRQVIAASCQRNSGTTASLAFAISDSSSSVNDFWKQTTTTWADLPYTPNSNYGLRATGTGQLDVTLDTATTVYNLVLAIVVTGTLSHADGYHQIVAECAYL